MAKKSDGDGVAVAPKKMGRPRLEEPSPEYRSRRADIVETAARVFHAKGYEAGSLDDVATALDLRKASLYYYVKSKAELLYLVFDRAISHGLEELEAVGHIEDPRGAHDRPHPPPGADRGLKSPGCTPCSSTIVPASTRPYEKEIAAKERRYLEAFSSTIAARRVPAGVVPEVDVRYAGQALLGMTTWIYKWFDPDRHDPEVFADTCVRLLVGADAAPAPKRSNGRRGVPSRPVAPRRRRYRSGGPTSGPSGAPLPTRRWRGGPAAGRRAPLLAPGYREALCPEGA